MKIKYIILFLFLIFTTQELKAENMSSIEDIENIFYESENIEQNSLRKELRVEQSLMIGSIDPIKMVDTYSRRVAVLMYDTLFIIDEQGKISSNILQEYKWIEENKLYMKLKEGIRFHDGSYLTSEDVERSLKRLRKEGVIKEGYNSIIGVEIIDDQSFVLNLDARDGLLIKNLTNPIAGIVKVKDGRYYGTGPYEVVNFNERELEVSLFRKYFRIEKNYYEKIHFTWELNSKQRAIKYINGGTDYIFDLYKEDVERLKEYGLLSNEDVVQKEVIYDTIALTFGDKKRYTLEEKRAIKKSIARDVKSFFPQEVIPPKLSKIKDDYNLKDAKNSMNESSLKNGTLDIMVLNTEYNLNIAKKVKENLEATGLKINLLPHNMISFYRKLYQKDYDLAVYNLTINKLSPTLSLEKIVMYDLIDREIISALLPFLELIQKEENYQKRVAIFDKVLSLLDKSILYIPIEHKLNYSVAKEMDIGRYHKILECK